MLLPISFGAWMWAGSLAGAVEGSDSAEMLAGPWEQPASGNNTIAPRTVFDQARTIPPSVVDLTLLDRVWVVRQ